MDAFDLKGEIAVVTGALGKLGPVWVETLLDAGANVLAIDRAGAPPSKAFTDLSGRFGPERLSCAAADVCSRPDLEAALARCTEVFGSPTILVNNAGIDAPPAADGKGYRLDEIPLAVNLRILEVKEIKTVPHVPLSHPFVERLIGTIRREYLDRILFWTTTDLEQKLLEFQHYYNGYRTHTGLRGRVPQPGADASARPAALRWYRWQPHCRGLYHTPIAA